MNHFTTVFSFTFRQLTGTKGWRMTTILMALLLFLLPALLPVAIDSLSGDGDAPALQCHASRLLVVDHTPGETDWSLYSQTGSLDVTVTRCDSVEDAAAQAGDDGLIVVAEQTDGQYLLTVLRPDDGPLTRDDAEACAAFLKEYFPAIQMQKAGLSMEALAALTVPVDITADTAEDDGGNAMLTEILSMILPYCTVMLLYFMVLFYGQSVATSAIAEKTSKLMDTFLVSVKPQAMMLGKVLAVSLGAVLQLSIWLAALSGGFVAGAAILRAANPASTSGFLVLMDSLGILNGMFTPAGIAIAVAIMLAGFLLYCALAAVGGALASKPEELSSTNMLFTMALVISFFCCLMGGGMMGSEGITLGWLDWVPFTAILATPSRVLLGQITPLMGMCSLALVLVSAVLICLLAGKVYQMMSFYRGAPPTPKRLLAMLRNR